MFNFLRFLLASLLLFSPLAFSDSGYWYTTEGEQEFKSGTPLGAITAHCEARGPQYKVSNVTIRSQTDTSVDYGYNCFSNYWQRSAAYKLCPTGDVYDDALKQCVPDEPNQCEAGLKAGPYKFGAYMHAGGFMLEDPSPPSASCISSCQYILDFKNTCYAGNSGNYCLRTYTSSGETCEGSGDGTGSGSSGDGDGPDAPPADPSDYDENGDPKPDPEEPYPCTKRTDAEGRQTLDCSPPRDDSNKCPNGYVWTGTFCAKPPKPPTDPTDPTDPSNPGDGGSDGSGDEKGLAKDSTLKSIEGKIDTTNSKLTGIDGKLGASNTLLQGIIDAVGKIPGGGGGNGNGDGDGEGEDESAASGLGCSQDLDCTGDPIQCATLRINKEHLCQTQLTAEAEQQIKSVFEGEENQLETKEVSVDSVFTDGLNAARWLPSTCPTPESVTVFGRSYSISWQPLCTFASALSALIVAMASIFFIVYLGKGLKGS